jgi:hypothetical protein
MNREGLLLATNNDGIDTAGTIDAMVVATGVEAPNPAPHGGAALDPVRRKFGSGSAGMIISPMYN